MPHLLIRGVAPEQLAAISTTLIAELANIFECPPDHILLECLHTTAVLQGEQVASNPFSFAKPQATDDGDIHTLRAENKKLKDELLKARKALQSNATGSSSYMSSRLRDALRE